MILSALGVGAETKAKRMALATLATIMLAIGVTGWRLLAANREVADLRGGVSARQARLSGDRRAARDLPTSRKPAALDRSRAVSSLRARLAALALRQGITVDEFQASTEEAPYLTSYATDNQDAGWMQVPVRISLYGRTPEILATLEELATIEVPFEIDSTEMTRRSADKKGMATIGTQIGMRVLVYRGES